MISSCRLPVFILFPVLVFLSGCRSQSPPPADDPDRKPARNPTLLISFDGFRYDYLERADTPHFDSLVAGGVQAEGLIPVFPSKTFPNHYSIATGLYPENSGLIGNTMYDPEWREWYRIGNREAVENGKWYEGEPIWNTLEKQDIRTGTMFWVGSEADIQEMHPTCWKPYDGDMSGEARIDTVTKWLSRPGDRAVNFATLYFEHVDSQGHAYGLKSDSLNAAISESDRLIGYLKSRLREAGLWDDINLVIVSDHGMVDLSADRIIEVDRLIEMNDVERVIWGPATMLQPEEGMADQVYGRLKAAEKHYRVYRKENLPDRFHLKNHRRVFDIILVAEPGYTPLDQNYKERFIRSLPSATHGYDNAEKSMQAFFVARGPAFKNGEKVPAFQNIHIYELLNKLMNAEPAPNDGVIDSVKMLLN